MRINGYNTREEMVIVEIPLFGMQGTTNWILKKSYGGREERDVTEWRFDLINFFKRK